MAERIGDPTLQELLEQNSADLNIDQSPNGLPRIRITFPKLDEASSGVVCDGCNEQGTIEYYSKNHSLPRHGVVVRLENLQKVSVTLCPLEEMNPGDPNLDTDKFFRCLDNCIDDKVPKGSNQLTVEDLTLEHVKSSLAPTHLSTEAVRNALQAVNPQ